MAKKVKPNELRDSFVEVVSQLDKVKLSFDSINAKIGMPPQVVLIENLLLLAEERLEQMKDPQTLIMRFRMPKPTDDQIEITLGTIEKLKQYIGKLKMTDENGYNYKEFLSDSSDDCPKYADGIPVSDCSHEIVDAVKQTDKGEHDYYQFDETDDDQPFHAQPPSNIVALDNVLSLAEEQVMMMDAWDVEKAIADDSILAVRAMLNIMKAGANLTTKEASNIALAQDQDNT